MTVWNFHCTCVLCLAEGADSVALRKKRSDLEAEAKAFIAKHDPFEITPTAAMIAKAEKIANSIASTYNAQRFAGVPRLALLGIRHWLFLALSVQPNRLMSKTMAAVANFLRSLAYEVQLKHDHLTHVRPTAHSRIDSNAVQPLISASSANLSHDEVDVANELIAFARKMALTLNGAHHSFNELMSDIGNEMGLKTLKI